MDPRTGRLVMVAIGATACIPLGFNLWAGQWVRAIVSLLVVIAATLGYYAWVQIGEIQTVLEDLNRR